VPIRLYNRLLLCAIAAPLLVSGSTQQQPSLPFVLKPYKACGIYEVGDKVGWTVEPGPSGWGRPPAPFSYVIKKNNHDVIKSGRVSWQTTDLRFDVAGNEPEMVYVTITWPAEAEPRNQIRRVFGAVVAPTKLRPAQPRPRDFDAFWKSKIKMLEDIPMNPVLTPKDSGKPDVEYATIQMDHINGAHVYGQLAKPKGEGKFPALVIYQWASPPYPLQKSWVTDRAAEGWLVLNIEPHDVLPDGPPSYYRALPIELKNYAGISQDDRDKCYFLQMYLADYRAVDYIAGRADWNGKTLVVNGTSMGGQQSLCVAGLHPKITHLIVEEPSGCDIDADLYGRQAGYPNFQTKNPKVAETAPYFDAINFASHIRATSLVAMGFVDTVAPPTGIWTAYNQIRGRKEAAPMFEAPHNNTATRAQQLPYSDRATAWLNALVKGQRIPPPRPFGS